jgi:hypothetical protein
MNQEQTFKNYQAIRFANAGDEIMDEYIDDFYAILI